MTGKLGNDNGPNAREKIPNYGSGVNWWLTVAQ